VGNFTTIARNVLSRLKRYKMISNRLRFVSQIIADCHFLLPTMYRVGQKLDHI